MSARVSPSRISGDQGLRSREGGEQPRDCAPGRASRPGPAGREGRREGWRDGWMDAGLLSPRWEAQVAAPAALLGRGGKFPSPDVTSNPLRGERAPSVCPRRAPGYREPQPPSEGERVEFNLV